MTTAREVRRACKDRGCRILWSMADTGRSIDVDHHTRTLGGSDVFVYRRFPGALVKRADDNRYDWNDEQTAAVAAWVEQLHRMPLEEIP